MILVDTSVWIDHLRAGDQKLSDLLNSSEILCHPFVTAELSLGNLPRRVEILGALGHLPQAITASHVELTAFINAHRMWGQGISLVDAHLLAATALTSDAKLWTRDRHLEAVAAAMGLAAAQKN